MIDLTALASLQAIETTGSVVAAADELGYTPSAISQQIKRLEKQTGVALLERVGRGVILTSSGHYLIANGADLFVKLEQIKADLQQATSTVAGPFRLAAFSTAVRGIVAPSLPSVIAEHPLLDISIHEREPWDTIDLVGSGRIDLGIVHRWGDVPLALPAHVESISLFHDVADVLVPIGHPLANRGRVSPDDLVGESWIATAEGTICRQWLNRMHDGTDHRPRVVHQAGEFDSHIALVDAGLGIALVPRLGRACLPESVVALEAYDPESTREVVLIYRSSMAASPSVLAVIAALRQAT